MWDSSKQTTSCTFKQEKVLLDLIPQSLGWGATWKTKPGALAIAATPPCSLWRWPCYTGGLHAAVMPRHWRSTDMDRLASSVQRTSVKNQKSVFACSNSGQWWRREVQLTTTHLTPSFPCKMCIFLFRASHSERRGLHPQQHSVSNSLHWYFCIWRRISPTFILRCQQDCAQAGGGGWICHELAGAEGRRAMIASNISWFLLIAIAVWSALMWIPWISHWNTFVFSSAPVSPLTWETIGQIVVANTVSISAFKVLHLSSSSWDRIRNKGQVPAVRAPLSQDLPCRSLSWPTFRLSTRLPCLIVPPRWGAYPCCSLRGEGRPKPRVWDSVWWRLCPPERSAFVTVEESLQPQSSIGRAASRPTFWSDWNHQPFHTWSLAPPCHRLDNVKSTCRVRKRANRPKGTRDHMSVFLSELNILRQEDLSRLQQIGDFHLQSELNLLSLSGYSDFRTLTNAQ